MTRSQLRFGRLVIPGVVILIAAIPVLWVLNVYGFKTSFWGISTTVAIAIAGTLGALYRLAGVRDSEFNAGLDQVQANIRTRLLAPYSNDSRFAGLKSVPWKRLRKVFYDIVDNDRSLESQTHEVYENGLFWTSAIDTKLIACVAAFVYMSIFAFIYADIAFLWSVVICAILILVAEIIVATCIRRHLTLSNAQIDVILYKYRDALEQKLIAILNE